MALAPNFTRADVEANFDPQSFRRALNIVDDVDLRSSGFSEDGTLTLVAEVEGTHLYDTDVEIRRVQGRAQLNSFCSCPVGSRCKHGAAVALDFLRRAATSNGPAEEPGNAKGSPGADSVQKLLDFLKRGGLGPDDIGRADDLGNGFGTAPPTPPAPQRTPDWERQLEEIAHELEAAQQPQARSPLALKFSVEPPRASRWNPDPAPILSIRPMKRGKKSNWIKTGISWSALASPWNERNFVEAQFSALSQLTEALNAYGNEPVTTHQLQAATPRVWNALEAARDAGVEFLAEGTARRVVLAQDPVEVRLGVQSHDGAATALLGVAWDGYTCAGSAVTALGRKAFAVALLPSQATEDDLVLARLSSPLSERLTMVLTYGRQIEVPPEGRERLAHEILPRMAPRLPVASSDPDFQQSPPEPPVLRADVSWDEQRRATLSFCFRYTHQGRTSDQPIADLDRSQGRIPRQPAAEDELLRNWEHGPATEALVPFKGLAPIGPTTYSGMNAVRVLEEVVPELRQVMDVHVDADVPEPRPLEGDPEISFDVADSGEDPHLAKRREQAPGPDDVGAEEPEDTDDAGDIDWFDLRVVIDVDGIRVPLPEVLGALTRGDEALLMDDGAYLRLDHPAFERLARLVENADATGLKAGRGDNVRVGTKDAAAWEEIEAAGVLPEDVERWVGNLRALQGGGRPEHVAAVGVETPLRRYQQDGLDWMHHLYRHGLGGILADDMGLGKTLQALALISTVKGTRRPGQPEAPFLVIAPTSVVPTWKVQAEQHTPGLRVTTITATSRKRRASIAELALEADVLVTSYTLFRQEADEYADLAWKGLVLDESQAIKNPASKTFHAVRRIHTDFALAVTGTPFENRLTELWPPLSIVAPGLYPTLEIFRDKVAKPVEKDGDQEALARLRRKIEPFMLRRAKSLVAQDLPEKQEEVLPVALEKSHQKFYDTLLQRERQSVLGLVEDFEQNRVAIFAALTRMRLAALHAGLAGGPEEAPSAKLTELVGRLTELAEEGHRALVFSQFTSYLKIIRSALEAAGLDCIYLDGSTKDRGRVLEAFREGKAPVFLISLKAGGTGLTLTEADYVFVMDPWWNPAVEAQAVDRAHRIGQTRQVMVYRMVSEGTIEEKVMALKERKSALFEQVIGDGTADTASFIGEDDIRRLME